MEQSHVHKTDKTGNKRIWLFVALGVLLSGHTLRQAIIFHGKLATGHNSFFNNRQRF